MITTTISLNLSERLLCPGMHFPKHQGSHAATQPHTVVTFRSRSWLEAGCVFIIVMYCSHHQGSLSAFRMAGGGCCVYCLLDIVSRLISEQGITKASKRRVAGGG